MRVQVTPTEVHVQPGMPVPISITVTNTSTVIGGYGIRLLGADPGWVKLDSDRVSMFPEESRVVKAVMTVPAGIPAGVRRIAVQVRELTPPHATAVAEIDLVVPAARLVTARLDPLAVTGGRMAKFTVLVENLGNTVVRAELAAEDAEAKVKVKFEPERIALAPGEHAIVDMEARAKQPIAGAPTPRILTLFLDDFADDSFFAEGGATPELKRKETDAVATGTFVQRSVLTRGPLALLGLIAAITVFAIIITVALSKLVGQSAADRNLALQIAAARESAGAVIGTSTLGGTVRLLSSGEAVPGVSVNVYDAGNTAIPVRTEATDNKGAYLFDNLAAGEYKIAFRGAKFLQLWYPGASTANDASTIKLAAGQHKNELDATVGGIPSTITGTVKGEDLAGATLYLEKSVRNGSAGGNSVVVPPALPGSPAGSPPDTGDAIVKTIPIGSDGAFSLTDVPSPSVYVLVLAKPGYATSSQRINVGPGEDRSNVSLTLRKGDGVIEGVVRTSGGRPLGNVSITASTGTVGASTVSLTERPRGSFTLRNLPTPGNYTLVASRDGFASQTLSLALAAGQKLTGVSMTLGESSGSLTGLVNLVHVGTPDTPGAGVAVSVTDGLLTVQTETQSVAPIGSWKITGLPIPGTYTVTFARPDLATQTVSVSLDAIGNVTAGSQSTTITTAGIEIGMKSATAAVYGPITQTGGATVCDTSRHLGEAVVTLNSGSSTFTVNSASVPADKCGQYRIENVPPGTYTLTVEAGSGTIPDSQVVQLAAGDDKRIPVHLARPASITGRVVAPNGTTGRCDWTVFLYLASEYPDTVTATTRTTGLSAKRCGDFKFPRVDAGTYIVAVGPTSDPVNTVVTVRLVVHPGEQYGTPAGGTSLVIKAATSG